MRQRCLSLIAISLLSAVFLAGLFPASIHGQNSSPSGTVTVTINSAKVGEALSQLQRRLLATQDRFTSLTTRLSSKVDSATSSATKAQRTKVTKLQKERTALFTLQNQLTPQITSALASSQQLLKTPNQKDYRAFRVQLVELEKNLVRMAASQKNILTLIKELIPTPTREKNLSPTVLPSAMKSAFP